MSSIASANPERTNRWLLIGAAALALLAGLLVFMALNAGGDDGETASPSAAGDVSVLVANQTIKPNTTIDESMFDRVSVASGAAVEQAASEPSAIIGKVARAEIINGQQISLAQVSLSGAETSCGLACILPQDKPGITLQGDEIALVAGFVQPGDRVNIIGVFTEDRGGTEITRVETILQNVEVMAIAQDSVEATAGVDAEGNPLPQTGSSVGTTSTPPDEAETRPGAGNVTLALTPQDAQLLAAARSRGTLTLTLQPAGVAPTDVPPTYFDEFGPLPQLPRR